MSKSNRELNQAHESKEQERVRPKHKDWDFEALTKVVNQWVRSNERSTL